jgi:predicted GIY-YIG superfamily endonuclease
MYYLCVLKNKENALYYGLTNNLEERFRRHNTNQEWKIVYYEAYLSERDARRREVKIKHYGQTRTRLKERISESLALK